MSQSQLNQEAEILLSKNGAVAELTINRPKVYNALNRATKLELASHFEKLALDNSIRAIVLTANGKAFCSGQDLNDRKATESSDLGQTLKEEWNPLVRSMRNCPQLIVGALNGVVAGAGISVAVQCDLLVAHPDVKFVSGFSKIGLCPDAGSNFAFVRALGRQRCMEFFTLGKALEVHLLEDLGIINRISDKYLERAREMAQQLATSAPLALATIKRNLNLAEEVGWEMSLDNEIKGQRILGNSADFKEGVSAFLEKRPAKFNGV
jgi:2-(1,2-epoxy-1,2-dihydrophenyl)acetyl-CoA isomerase